MSEETQAAPAPVDEPLGASQAFINYCEAEFVCRKNSSDSFDEAGYLLAMDLTLGKLQALEEEGYA